MVEPVDLEAWIRQEEGFAWIDEARRSPDPGERQRAGRALEALERSLRRIAAQDPAQGWIRHRQVRYLLLAEQAGEEVRVMTLARAIPWLDSPASDQPPPGQPR